MKKLTEIEKMEAQAVRLAEKIKKAKDNQCYDCPQCKISTAIKEMNLEVEIFYVEPSGCTDGDYWTEGTEPEYALTCPACHSRRRFRDYKPKEWDYKSKEYKVAEPLGMTKFISDNRYHFKDRVKYTMERQWDGKNLKDVITYHKKSGS
jgi:hypothetical protein